MGQIMILFSLFLVFVYSSLHRCGTDIQHRIIFGVVPFYFVYHHIHICMWPGMATHSAPGSLVKDT